MGYIAGLDSIYTLTRGRKKYEASNHLGNVMVVFTDKRINQCINDSVRYYRADLRSAYDYYPFGMLIPDRTFDSTAYIQLPDRVDTTISQRIKIQIPNLNPGQNITLTKDGETYVLAQYQSGYTGAQYSATIAGSAIVNELSFEDSSGYLIIENITLGGQKICSGIPSFSLNIAGTNYIVNCSQSIDTVRGGLLYEAGYLFGFQGQEKDDEVFGIGNTLSFKYRVHDARLGRFLSVDPLYRDYPWNSPYAFSENRVSNSIELEGLEAWDLPGGGQIFGPYANQQTAQDSYNQKNGTFGTNPSELIQNGSLISPFNHRHSDDINLIYHHSGGNELFQKHDPAGCIDATPSEIEHALNTVKNSSSGQIWQEYTNSNEVFFVSDNTVGSQVGFCNWMLGNFVFGLGPENYVFSEESVFSQAMRNSDIVASAIKEWHEAGQPSSFSTKSRYNLENVASNVPNTGTFYTIEEFVGSAHVFIQRTTANEISLMIVNVTSLTSGDYSKDFPAHGSWPISTVRGTENQRIPYSNISQTFMLKYKLDSAFKIQFID